MTKPFEGWVPFNMDKTGKAYSLISSIRGKLVQPEPNAYQISQIECAEYDRKIGYHDPGVYWRLNKPFEATFSFRSWWKGVLLEYGNLHTREPFDNFSNLTFEMTIVEFIRLASKGWVQNGKLEGKFMFVKRGTTFKLVGIG